MQSLKKLLLEVSAHFRFVFGPSSTMLWASLLSLLSAIETSQRIASGRLGGSFCFNIQASIGLMQSAGWFRSHLKARVDWPTALLSSGRRRSGNERIPQAKAFS